ncbi:MAG TPA: ATP-binding protein [Acidimicrobiia bacterium]|nr:ATP-binding protein [Acidimicrobiia bacterium]
MLRRDSKLHLAGDLEGPRVARAFLSDALLSWHQQRHSDVAALLVSELVTNAIVHGRSPVQLRVAMLDSTIRVEVNDDSREAPIRAATRPDEPGGYGLPLVDSLADEWGYDLIPGDGKRVWFELEAV